MVGALLCVVAAEGPILDLSNSAHQRGASTISLPQPPDDAPIGSGGVSVERGAALLRMPHGDSDDGLASSHRDLARRGVMPTKRQGSSAALESVTAVVIRPVAPLHHAVD
jgi:hypothetical protein